MVRQNRSQFKTGDKNVPIEISHAQVKDFGETKRIFDSRSELRTSFGALSEKIYRSDDNPNMITIVIEWDSLANARKYAQSPELKPAQQKAGIVGSPTTYFLNEA